jgi:hypothetical protein
MSLDLLVAGNYRQPFLRDDGQNDDLLPRDERTGGDLLHGHKMKIR